MIFVDSSFWIAQMVVRDGRHQQAVAMQDAFDLGRLVTSSAVIAESWTFLRRRSGYRDAMTWLDRVLDASNLRRERVDEHLEAEAWAWLRLHDERVYSFVDATSFALMRRKRITDVLAFDGDFTAAGFTELRS